LAKKFPLFTPTKACDMLARFRSSSSTTTYTIKCADGEYFLQSNQIISHPDVSSDSEYPLVIEGNINPSFKPTEPISKNNKAYLATFTFPVSFANDGDIDESTHKQKPKNEVRRWFTYGHVRFYRVNVGYRNAITNA
jgi:hypothetical protein